MVIAEIGLNHLGDYKEVKSYLNTLLNTKVEGIEFQVRDSIFYARPEKKDLELNQQEYIDICQQIKDSGKNFGVALTDITKLDFFESIGTDFYKVIINDIKNKELVEALCKTGKKVFISTGLSSNEDIEELLSWAYCRNIVLNHTQLSNEASDSNLKAIKHLRDTHKVPVSFGSHCSNHNILYMSLCFEPSDILFYVKNESKAKKEWEKTGYPYPDEKHAILLEDVPEIVDNIKNLEKAIGSGIKKSFNNKLKIRKH